MEGISLRLNERGEMEAEDIWTGLEEKECVKFALS